MLLYLKNVEAAASASFCEDISYEKLKNVNAFEGFILEIR